jgi:hypothetical protein
MTWGNQFRGMGGMGGGGMGMGSMGRMGGMGGMGRMGGMGGMGGIPGQTGFGTSEWYWPGRQQPKGKLEKWAPWGQMLGSLFAGMWGPEAQNAKLAREKWEQEVKWKEEEDERRSALSNLALRSINAKWGNRST